MKNRSRAKKKTSVRATKVGHSGIVVDAYSRETCPHIVTYYDNSGKRVCENCGPISDPAARPLSLDI